MLSTPYNPSKGQWPTMALPVFLTDLILLNDPESILEVLQVPFVKALVIVATSVRLIHKNSETEWYG